MSIETSAPISLPSPDGPDADWLTIRDRVASQLARTAPPAWTDHNVPDPGITLLEAAAFSIADVHYRVASAGFENWPLAWQGWLDDRPWQGSLPAPSEDTAALAPLLDAVADALSVAGADAERAVLAATSPADAQAVLAAAPFAVPGPVRAAAVTVLRSRQLRRIALEHADVIADAVANADGDDAAAADIEARTGLWAVECAALVVRERRRLTAEKAATFADRIAVAGADDVGTLASEMVDAGLSADEARIALAAQRLPATTPEGLERTNGDSELWPPHPIQALTCEPVVADDYARRARTHPTVTRAWAVQGRLVGIAWNGLPVRDPAFVPVSGTPEAQFGFEWAADPAADALTIVVDASVGDDVDASLRAILAHAIGSEVFTPAPTWRDSLDDLDPRRLVCDEVGIALLAKVQVLVQATLIVPPTASHSTVIAAAAAAVSAFFTDGRSENLATVADDPLSGPWPPAPQPPGGWLPGDPIRFSEVVERLMGVQDVIAVTRMAMRTVDTTGWTFPAAGELSLPPGTVPELAGPDCLTTSVQVADSTGQGTCHA